MTPISVIAGRNGSELYLHTAAKIRSLALQKKDVILIVPAQYTLAAERLCIESLGDKCMPYVKITTLGRLARKHFTDYGTPYTFIGNAGKNVLIAKAYGEVSDRLKRFKGYYHINFIEELSAKISDFKAFGVTPSALAEASEENERLADIATIYFAYDALLGTTLADGDDVLKIFADCVDGSGLYTGKHIFAEFFKYMSAAETGVFEAFCADGAQVTVSLLTLNPGNEYDIFCSANEVYHRLKRFCAKTGTELMTEFFEKSTRYKAPSLSFLEENLYSESPKEYVGESSVTMYRASDTSDELDFIGAEISRLVRDEGYKYSDFAVVTRNPERYAAQAEVVFSQYDIPVFYHRNGSVRQKTATRFLLALFSVAIEGYKPDSVTELLRSGVFDFEDEALAAFEKYVGVWGVKYGAFLKPFEKNINGLRAASDLTEEDRRALMLANEVRTELTELVESFKSKTKDAATVEIAAAIYDVFCALDIETKLAKTGEEYRRFGENALYAENVQVYGTLLKTLDEFAEVIGDDKISLSRFRDLLLLVISSADINIIPTSLDEVLAGDAATAPLLMHKCVFVYGLYDGSFPVAVTDSGLISSREKEFLAQQGIHIGKAPDDEILYESFLAYFAITSASERVYLSYPAIDGDEKSPSEPFEAVRKMFPKLAVLTSPTQSDAAAVAARIQRQKAAFGLFTRLNVENLREVFEKTEFERFLKPPAAQTNFLLPQTAQQLFGTDMSITPSRSDTFSQCPYMYYLKYGLYLNEDSAANFNPANTGTFLHAVLESVIGTEGWLTLSDEQLRQRVDRCVLQYFKDIFGDEIPPASFLEYAKNLTKKSMRLLTVFREEFLQSAFSPVAFELSIAGNGDILPVVLEIENGKIRLGGKVDRVDAYICGDKTYIRIVDYKSRAKKLCFSDIYEGINIQLLCYLYALRENGSVKFGNVEPAGAMYVNVRPGIKSCERGKEPDTSALESSGIFLNDINVLNAMENGLNGKYIPVTEKKINGENIVGKEQFEIIFEHIKKIFCDMGDNLLRGNIQKQPLETGDGSKCAYCPVASVCEQTENARKSVSMKKDEFFEALKGEENK